MADDKTKKSTPSNGGTGAATSDPASNTGVRANAAPSELVTTAAVRKVKFAVEQKSPTLEIGHGEYSRRFVADDQPFEVSDEEEFTMLLGTGLFVEA
jgi:hypothetical protein